MTQEELLAKRVLEDRLEKLLQTDGPKEEIQATLNDLMAVDELRADPQTIARALRDTVVGATPSAVPAPEAQKTTSEKEPEKMSDNTSLNVRITKADLGIGVPTEKALGGLSLDTIKQSLVSVEDTDDVLALVIPNKSVIDPAHRIHVQERGEVRRVARGLGIALLGGVSESGAITSPNGNVHFIKDGVCYEKRTEVQFDSFASGQAVIERDVPCQGHFEYRNVGSSDKPVFKATGREFMRCQHQWAMMFANGYWVTLSKSQFYEVVITEIAQRAGDESCYALAQKQIAQWVENGQRRFETRKAFAQAIQHERNTLGIPDEGKLPPVPQVLDFKLEDGRSVREAILALKGVRFVVEYTVPINGEAVTQRVRAASQGELVSRMAPALALGRVSGGAVAITKVFAA